MLTSACNEIIEDIEDLIESQEIPTKARYSSKKITIRKKGAIGKVPKEETEQIIHETYLEPGSEAYRQQIPGTQKIYVKTWGCAHNNSDSEYMAGLLACYGYRIVQDNLDADLWLLNSCTVKNPAEDHFRNEIEKGKKLGKFIVLAGCVPQGGPKALFLKNLSIIGVQQIDRIVEVVEETLKGNRVRLLGSKKENGKKIGGASLELPKIRKNPLIEIIAINTGCLNQCTYCKTKHARGDLGSYQPQQIIQRAIEAFKQGVVEIWLTSEDTGAYGKDIGTSLSELLHLLIEVIPEGCKLRLGMTNPPYIRDQLEEIARALNSPRIYKFIHIPVQSASDNVLKDMRREYTCKEFEYVVNFLRRNVLGISIATDIICGFPTETEDDFQQTYELCEKYKFPSLFINQFYPRSGTPAARLPRIPAIQVKARTKRLTDLFHSYVPYNHKLNMIEIVLVTDISNDKKCYVGHNDYYEQVLIEKHQNDEDYLLGKMVQVKIIKCSKFSIVGKLLNSDLIKRPKVPLPLKKGQVSLDIMKKSSESSSNIFKIISFFFALILAFIFRIWIFN